MKPVTLMISAAIAATVLGASGLRARDESGPYAAWKNGPGRDRSFFPIAVWLQDPTNAERYKAAGFNLYVGLWQGPTEAQLAALKRAGMPVICEQNRVGLSHKEDPTIIGWMHGDEPDNAQPVRDPATGKEGYGPCVPPQRIVNDYQRLKALDPTRPIMLNLGQGVANDQWIGRGNGSSLKDYETYVKGADVISFDVYPMASPELGIDKLWYVPKGVSRLVNWTAGKTLIWNCIECTSIGGDGKATPAQVRSEVWMALIAGSRGLIYFVHQFKPTFDEHALLDDPPMLREVTAINTQIRELSSALNSPTVTDGATVSGPTTEAPVSIMVKRQGKTTYLFTAGMRNVDTSAEFHLNGLPKSARARVLGETRTIEVNNGRFTDRFIPYGVHLYKIVEP